MQLGCTATKKRRQTSAGLHCHQITLAAGLDRTSPTKQRRQRRSNGGPTAVQRRPNGGPNGGPTAAQRRPNGGFRVFLGPLSLTCRVSSLTTLETGRLVLGFFPAAGTDGFSLLRPRSGSCAPRRSASPGALHLRAAHAPDLGLATRQSSWGLTRPRLSLAYSSAPGVLGPPPPCNREMGSLGLWVPSPFIGAIAHDKDSVVEICVTPERHHTA